MRNFLTKTRTHQVAAIVALTMIAGLQCFAVDPTLSDVSDLFTAHVTAILTFAVAVIGAFIGAALIPVGLKKLWHYVMKLLGLV